MAVAQISRSFLCFSLCHATRSSSAPMSSPSFCSMLNWPRWLGNAGWSVVIRSFYTAQSMHPVRWWISCKDGQTTVDSSVQYVPHNARTKPASQTPRPVRWVLIGDLTCQNARMTEPEKLPQQLICTLAESCMRLQI